MNMAKKASTAYAQRIADLVNFYHCLLFGAPFRYAYYDDNMPATAIIKGQNQPSETYLPGGGYAQQSVLSDVRPQLCLRAQPNHSGLSGPLVHIALKPDLCLMESTVDSFYSGMSNRFVGMGCLLLIGLACQPKKKSETEAPVAGRTPVAVLSKATYSLGDSIPITLTRPASQLSVRWNAQPAPFRQLSGNLLTIKMIAEKVGWQQLIVNGTEPNKGTFSDTLQVELRSNIVPAERGYAVLTTYPHQTGSFTQGLEFHRGELYESTGLNGQSRLMKINRKTGVALKTDSLPNQHFGEGITIVNDKIYQLTWTSGLCFRYNLDFTPDKTFTYHTQGWGLTHRDSTLLLSDGSNKLYFYTPDLKRVGELPVYDDKGPVTNLNELEYVNGYVFANIWQSNRIAQIELATGRVVAYLNMERILPPGIDTKENVLNGIAYEPTENALYVTGKNWPTLVKIRVDGLGKGKPGKSLQ